MCLKQSLPFVRCVGEGWPLSQDRCRIEAEALMLEYKLCPEHTPEVRGQRPGEGGGSHQPAWVPIIVVGSPVPCGFEAHYSLPSAICRAAAAAVRMLAP